VNVKTAVKAVLPYFVSRSTYNSIHGFVAARDIVSGRRHEPQIDLLKEFVKPGQTVLDIGANQGLYSYHLSQLVGPSGKVYAFEPIPFNVNILKRVAAKSPNITIREQGCGERRQNIEFFVPVSHRAPIGGWAHRRTAGEDGNGEIVKAEIVRLDDEISERVSFIKCDVEGAELSVFKGAVEILAKWRPVILCEIFDPWCSRFGIAKSQVLKFFAELGYHDRQLNEDNSLLLPTSR
jgi:FkbM family methyltransferase